MVGYQAEGSFRQRFVKLQLNNLMALNCILGQHLRIEGNAQVVFHHRQQLIGGGCFQFRLEIKMILQKRIISQSVDRKQSLSGAETQSLIVLFILAKEKEG